MKKFLLLILFGLLSYQSNAQILISLLFGDKLNTPNIEFGLEGGLNESTIQNLPNANNIAGFNLGFYFDFKMKKNPSWMLNTGIIMKSPMGAGNLPVYVINNPSIDNAFVGGSVNRKLRYFSIPVLMKYKFKNNLYLKGGFQIGIMHKAFDEFKKSISEKDDLNYQLNIKDQYHTLDAGLAFGVGYDLMKMKGMHIGVQYYYGMTTISKNSNTGNQYNRSLYLNVGIPIGKTPKKSS
jgi:hypothetical protein